MYLVELRIMDAQGLCGREALDITNAKFLPRVGDYISWGDHYVVVDRVIHNLPILQVFPSNWPDESIGPREQGTVSVVGHIISDPF